MRERKAMRTNLAQEPMDLAAAPIVVGTPDHTSTGGRYLNKAGEKLRRGWRESDWPSIQLTQPGCFPRAEFEPDIQNGISSSVIGPDAETCSGSGAR
jgi:hypothetical protein